MTLKSLPYLIGVAIFFLVASGADADSIDGYGTDTFSLPEDRNPVVFVPGILGSTLEVDGEKIWGGTNFGTKRMFYYQEQEVNTSVLSSVRLLGRDFRNVAYGPFLAEQASDPSARGHFFTFSYDWRASNERSAEVLADFFCKIETTSHRPFIIVAHSMGGLVVKHWLTDHYSSRCPNGKKIEIGAILFVATPHAGSPKAFLTLANRADLLGIGVIDEAVLKSVNRFGYSFDSAYELLPFTLASDGQGHCLDKSEMRSGPRRNRLFYAQGNATEPRAIDPYTLAFWQALGVIEKLEELSKTFPNEIKNPTSYLSDKLASAERVACKLLRFELPSELEDRVLYLAGRITDESSLGMRSTPSEVWITDFEDRNYTPSKTFIDPETGYSFFLYVKNRDGDETVPFDVATNDRGKIDFERAIGRTRRDNRNHLEILTSPLVREIVDRLTFLDLGRSDGRDGVHETRLPHISSGDPATEIAWWGSTMEQGDLTGESKAIATAISETGLIDANSIANSKFAITAASPPASFSSRNVINSSAFVRLLEGSFKNEMEIVDYVQGHPSSDNWRFVGSLEGIEPEIRFEAKYNAARSYMMEGRSNEAVRVFYELSNDPDVVGFFVNGKNLKSLAAVGLELSANYAGPRIIFDTQHRQAYNLDDANTWTQIDVQAILEAVDSAAPFSSDAWNGDIAEGLGFEDRQ